MKQAQIQLEIEENSKAYFFVADTRPISHRVGRSVRPSHFAFFAFLGILRVEKFVFEHAPAQIITAPAQIITAPAQIITAPAQPSATGAVVYTALFQKRPSTLLPLFFFRFLFFFHFHIVPINL